MKNALVMSLIGILLCLALGMGLFGLSMNDVFLSVAVGNLAGFVGVMVTIRSTQDQWFGPKLFKGTLRTWILISTIFWGIIVALAPPMRNAVILLVMTIPLILSCGFAIILFGIIQDRIVRRRFRRS